MKNFGKVCAVVGGQWGDEGKGKLVDILAEEYDLVVRATGGANAGHTIYVTLQNGQTTKFVFHLVPAGMLHPGKLCIMGNGMVVHFPTLLEELGVLKKAHVKTAGRLKLSDRAHIVFEYHKIIDRLQEELKGGKRVGTTGRGIGPAYTDKISRIGIRVGELRDFRRFSEHYLANLSLFKKIYDFRFDGEAELKQLKKITPKILPLIADTSLILGDALRKGKSVLLEGANGALLDIDHGTYPFVTSSNASIGGILAGSGLAPNRLTSSIGIMKAYLTRVGSGPFPTELKDALGDEIRRVGNEFGATTGRPRRCGWFDTVAARYSVRLNGFTGINLTKVDVLNFVPRIKIGVGYMYKGKKVTEFPADLSVLEACRVEYMEMPGWQEDISTTKTFQKLPKNCRRYIEKLEQLMGCPVRFIGTGKTRQEMIYR